jgi:hypothetical protein
MRTRIDVEASAFCASCAHATASRAEVKTQKKASPCVSTSTPPCAATVSRINRLCSSSASA